MITNHRRSLGLGISLAMLALAPALSAQSSKGPSPEIDEWSSHHIVLSPQARAVRSERLRQAAAKRQVSLQQFLPATPVEITDNEWAAEFAGRRRRREPRHRSFERDWSLDMGPDASVGATNYPAKYSFDIENANCATDFVVYATGLAGTLNQAGIVAYNNIYSGCGGTVPSVYWAYDTNSGQVTTSPVFSLDGTQVAFVQTNPSGYGEFVVLRWAASSTDTITDPTPLSRTTNTGYPTCTAPCMTSAELQTPGGISTMDATSSVFYDYNSDTAYVGDEAGFLHQFNPVFNGVPEEVTINGWPVQVNTTSPTALTSPVHDYNSGRVFVADTGGYLYRIGPGSFVAQSGLLDYSESEDGGPGIVQGPVVDSVSELVYVFAAADGSGGCTSGADCAGIYQFGVDFPGASFGLETTVGSSTIAGQGEPNPLYIGAFDSTYENSGNATGHLYGCGNNGLAPTLYQIPFQAGVPGAAIAGPVLAPNTDAPACSPVSDIYNPNTSGGPTEWFFLSVQNDGESSGCSAAGCIFNFKDTAWQASTAYSVGQEILDSSLHIEVVTVAGTSGAMTPFWNGSTGKTTPDHTVTWLDQGPLSAATPAAWQALHIYTKGTEILDGNNNIELATSSCVSGLSITFTTTPGGTTSDGTCTWTNLGAIATEAARMAGGTSGMVMDNTASSAAEAGASQIYFSTLGNEACATSGGTGGCAIQASQSALQ